MEKIIALLIFVCIAFGLFAQEADSLFLAADQSLMTMPTAYTMPKGSNSLTSYEVLLLQYAYAISDRSHFSIGMVFPISTDMLRTTTLGTKINYLKYKKTQAAVSLSYIPDAQVAALGNVISIGSTRGSVHLMINRGQSLDGGGGGFIFGLGGIKTFSTRVSGMLEFYNFSDILDIDYSDDEEDDLTDMNESVLLFGIRFKGEKMSWDLGGIRPLVVDDGDLLAIPFVKGTFIF
ncbi:MAG: hypothetical protein KA984_03540 [Candidatus Cloacimonetes bacterium]|nr:hypothetical protein [Candidatus Cloacimonadota bacterium]